MNRYVKEFTDCILLLFEKYWNNQAQMFFWDIWYNLMTSSIWYHKETISVFNFIPIAKFFAGFLSRWFFPLTTGSMILIDGTKILKYL